MDSNNVRATLSWGSGRNEFWTGLHVFAELKTKQLEVI
jgi:hypothetical protein